MKRQNATFSPSCMDLTIAPGDDFFRFAIGGWLKKNPIPPTEARWGSFYVLRENVRQDLRDLLLDTARKPSRRRDRDEKLVTALWSSILDEKERATRNVRPLVPFFKEIESIRDARGIMQFIAKGQRRGIIDGMFAPYVARDDKNSAKNILHLFQAGLSLPDRDYYLKDDEDSKKVRAAYRAYIPRLLKFAKWNKKEALAAVDQIMRLENELAKVSMTRVERRDPHAQYNKRTLSVLVKEVPGIEWKRYFREIGVGLPRVLIVAQPKLVKRVSELLSEVPLNEWKTYLKWHLLNGSASVLTPSMEREVFKFYSQELSGTKKQRTKEERAVSVVDGTLGDALGKLYVRRHFNEKARKRINELVDNLFVVYADRIRNLDWMTPATKKKALIKLRAMKRKLGYPSRWRDYGKLQLEPKDYFGNLLRVHEYEWRRMMQKLKKKPDSHEWHMTAPTVNAYYSSNENEIVFPAGIMQPPLFDVDADDALNYGGIGSVIGHEITHGFDDEGRKFDGKGNLKDWWTAEDTKRFTARAQELRKQYDGFIAVENMRVNGQLTLGENIADLGGVVIAYDAFQRSRRGKKDEQKIDGLTPDERFFLSLAMFECGHTRPEALKKQLVTDPHSPAEFRINGPLPHHDAFYKTFNVQLKHKLYRKPEKRVKIW